jgi:hypothetical protein
MLHLFENQEEAGLLGWFDGPEPGVPLAYVTLAGAIIPNRH